MTWLQVCFNPDVLAHKVAPFFTDLCTLLTFFSFIFWQNHPVPEATEDQGAAAESDRGLWPADGHVLYGERGRAKMNRWID